MSVGGTIARVPALNEAIPENSPHPDLALARRAAERDESAWRDIYDATRERLFALLCYHTGRREEALELLQETYLHAIKDIHRYRGDGPLGAWLAIIAIRRARDWKRKIMRWRSQQATLAEDPPTQVAEAPDHSLRRRLDGALSQLKGNQRAAFLLREMHGMSFREVGGALGCNEATARVHFHRARQAMQEVLSPGHDEPNAAPRTGGKHVTAEELGETRT
jgi:RNA polymerase sigma factor (sigma-70 family)